MRIHPKKRLGQNFLIDRNIAQKIIRALELKASDTLLEIGAGQGELTSLIAPKVKKVYALELDKRLKPVLAERFKDCANVIIINQDVLKFDLGNIVLGNIKVFGNIPYYISSPIIEHLIKYKDKVREAFITVQKEFARRVVASPCSKDYGAFSIFAQYHTCPKIVFQISRGCFYPVPKVDSCLLSLKFRESPAVNVKSEELFFKIVRAAFNQRRKTLRNSLKGIVPAEKLEVFLSERGKSPNARPEELSLADFGDFVNTIP